MTTPTCFNPLGRIDFVQCPSCQLFGGYHSVDCPAAVAPGYFAGAAVPGWRPLTKAEQQAYTHDPLQQPWPPEVKAKPRERTKLVKVDVKCRGCLKLLDTVEAAEGFPCPAPVKVTVMFMVWPGSERDYYCDDCAKQVADIARHINWKKGVR